MSTALAMPVSARMIPLSKLLESKLNPRKTFEGLEELKASIAEHGLLVPLLVRELPTGNFEILAGARRSRAAKMAGLEEVPCHVRPASDVQAVEVILIENLQRVDVHPLEEADTFRELLDRLNGDMDELSKRLSKPRPFLRKRLALLTLVPEVRKLWLSRRIGIEHAQHIAVLQPKDQKEVASWFKQEDLTASKLAESIERVFMLDLKLAPWDMKDADLVKKAGPCATCPKRTTQQKDLFSEFAGGDRCSDATCFRDKAKAFLDRREKDLLAKGEKPRRAYGAWVNSPTKEILQHHEYRVTKKGACANTVPLLLCDFKGGLGKVVYGCIAKDGGCKTCGTKRETSGSDTYQAEQKRQREKAKFEKAYRAKILTHVLEIHRETPERLLRRVVIASFQRLWDNAKQDLCKFLAAEVDPEFALEKGKYGRDYTKATQKMRTADPAMLNEVALALSLAPDLSFNTDGEDLKGLAKELSIDLKAVEKEVRESLVKKPKGKKKANLEPLIKAAARVKAQFKKEGE